MANSFELFKQYIDNLDEVYKVSSKTAVLDGDSTLVKAGANANEIIIPKIDMDGLGEYSRTNGYAAGSATITNETVTFNYDRGRKFDVDAMDNQETAGLVKVQTGKDKIGFVLSSRSFLAMFRNKTYVRFILLKCYCTGEQLFCQGQKYRPLFKNIIVRYRAITLQINSFMVYCRKHENEVFVMAEIENCYYSMPEIIKYLGISWDIALCWGATK